MLKFQMHIIVFHVIPLLREDITQKAALQEGGKTGLTAILLLVLIPVCLALIGLAWFIYKHTIGKKFQTTIAEDYKAEADKYEKAGKFVSAAAVYENRLKDSKKAAVLYEKGGDFKRAAELYDFLGISDKAKEMYEKSGRMEDAAQVSMVEGDFEGAAKLYDKAGKKLDAAEVMVRSGRKLAAVRIYREAGKYKTAARLLAEEGMLKEAAEMFGLSLAGKKPDPSNLIDYYTLAYMCEKAGDKGKALDLYRGIDLIDPAFKDVREKIQTAPAPEEPEEELGERTSLRSFIRSGPIEPKYGLKLWVQILRTANEVHKNGKFLGNLSPDSIAIDAQNKITFIKRKLSSAYVSPEATRGLAIDGRADIYSLGIVLFEMLTGNLEGLGSVRVIDVAEEVPDWLDEIVIRCIRKVREDRYQSIEDIFADLKSLSQGKKQPG